MATFWVYLASGHRVGEFQAEICEDADITRSNIEAGLTQWCQERNANRTNYNCCIAAA